MVNSDFGTRAREHRSSGAVLKVRVSNIRSRNRAAVIAVVEGVEDVGPYEVWTKRINHDLDIEFAPAAGKSQVLDFRRRMRDDQSGLTFGIYLFVDRDFDGLRGQPEGEDIFCTGAYSVENYLVSEGILRSILSDEFRCTADTGHREDVVRLFERVLFQFNDCIREANRRLFYSRRLDGPNVSIEEKISRYVDISLCEVRKVYDASTLMELVPFDEDIPLDAKACLDCEFDGLDPLLGYRGKFLLAFFRVWLEKLAEEGRRDGQAIFPDGARIRFSVGNLTLRSLATRSVLPDGLERFVQRIEGPVDPPS